MMKKSDAKKILLVDDDRDIVDSTDLRLRAAGYETITAFTGKQGLDSAIRHQPDAIILDVRMPEMDGLRALAELKRRDETKRIPVVMLSASVIDQNVCLDAGARFFVKKPYASQHLLAAIDTAMAESQKTETPKW